MKRLLILTAAAGAAYYLVRGARELASLDLGDLLDDVLVVDFGDEEDL